MESPKGKRFSQLYMARQDLLPDSQRLRMRLATLYGRTEGIKTFGEKLQEELGIPVSGRAEYASFWPEFIMRIDLRDVLDSVTVRYETLQSRYHDSDGTEAAELQKSFLENVRRIFAEEQIQDRIDDRGGVHFVVDSDFENDRIATIAGLGKKRYNSVRLAYEEAFQALDRTPPDGKAAVRAAFFATEGLFRLMFPSSHQSEHSGSTEAPEAVRRPKTEWADTRILSGTKTGGWVLRLDQGCAFLSSRTGI